MYTYTYIHTYIYIYIYIHIYIYIYIYSVPVQPRLALQVLLQEAAVHPQDVRQAEPAAAAELLLGG